MRPTDALPHPEEWETTTVGRSVDLKRGVSWSKEQEHAEPGIGRVPVIGIGNVQTTLELHDLLYLSGLKPVVVEKTRVTAGWTVLVGSNGNRARVGNAVFVREDADFLFASFLLGAKPKLNSRLNPEYFFRWLSSEKVQGYLSASSEGTTGLNNLSQSFFRAMEVALPTPDEQIAITGILDAADTALERTRAAVDRASSVKRAVLQRFFYEALGETAYADRPRRKLPAGWSLIVMGLLLSEEPKNGVSPEASSQPPGTPTFSIAAIRDGRVVLATKDHLKYARIPEAVAKRYAIHRGDVLIVRGNANPDLVGRAAMVSTFPDGCIYPDIVKRIVFRTDLDQGVIPEFGVLAWNHPIIHNQVLRRAKTSNGTLKINSRDVKQIVMPVPPEQEQAELVRVIMAVDAQVDALNRAAEAQHQLKSALLFDLLTGHVRVTSKAEVAAP